MQQPKSDLPEGSILESDSPDPSLLTVVCLDPQRDYTTQPWKNGLGTTSEISIYPPEKDFKTDTFFWRLSVHQVEDNCAFSLFPGYECTTVVLPDNRCKPTLLLNHQGNEVSTMIKPLFPYTWQGEWETQCKVTNAPVTNLQFMMKRDLGVAQFYVDKIGQPVSNESGETGKRLILGSFCLVYVVEGHVRITVDEGQLDSHVHSVSAGQTFYIEHDEEASPSSMMVQASDKAGNVNSPELDATLLTIQISEKKITAPSTTSDYFAITKSTDRTTATATTTATTPLSPYEPKGDAPSRRREPRRKGSLVVYDDLPPKSLEQITGEATEAEREGRREKLRPTEAQSYEVPPFGPMYDTDTPPPVVRDRLVIEDFPKHSVSTAWIKMIQQGLSEWIRLPVIICRGSEEGPVVGITAAVHGNELNGVPCIHRVVAEIDVKKLHGTVVAVPCVNVTGYLQFSREFADGRDLNRLFPGKEDGFASQVYCYQLMNKIISQFNYLIDLHTASFGRVNSYYVRADMNDPMSAIMAHLQKPQIVLHNSGQDGTLRSAASARGIKAVTVEIGNPQLFQNQYVQWSYKGVMRILDHLDMFSLNDTISSDTGNPPTTILCSKGFWIYTRTGGVLEVYPDVNTMIFKGDLIARIKNIFGNIVDEYFAPCGGIVIGRSSNPVAMSGDRILHLGVIKKKGENLPKEAKENY
ncbi:hypothetical protein BDF14DRAFT_1785992 [Spinellus fusiger]|nr:hypothetical protein BDF14DRAFT_1785992 [Spinellus fusiger]